MPPSAIVLIEIDDHSRLHVFQTRGVRIGFIDRRVERDFLTILPEQEQAELIMERCRQLQLISAREDDPVRTAAATIMRLFESKVVVARGPDAA